MLCRLSLEGSLQALILVSCFCWLPCCRAQDYQLVVNRDFFDPSNLGPDSNTLRLTCRATGGGQEPPEYMFFLNGTNLKERLETNSFTETSNSLTFKITRELEGNFACGPSEVSTSSMQPLVAYPLPNEPVRPMTIPVVAGNDAELPPLIRPGALLQRYFIDWMNKNTSQTLARIQGPRNQQSPFEPDARYSVDPSTFTLTVRSVTFEDRGSYLGVVGVRDPGGLSFTYLQTQANELTLEVIVPPSVDLTPLDEVVSLVDSNVVAFTCTVEGYPMPNIRWYHDRQDVTMDTDKYKIAQSVRGGVDSPFIVESNLMIAELNNRDSGDVVCVAMVTTDNGWSFSANKSTSLSVLGEPIAFNVFVTINNGAILRINLAEPMNAEVQLFIRYTDSDSGRMMRMTTTNRYSQLEEITFIDERIPYDKFSVDVALVSGGQMGPLHRDSTDYNRFQPTELDPLLMMILPYVFGLLALLIVTVLVIVSLCICFCRKQCLPCCYKINSDGTRANFLNKKIPGGLTNLENLVAVPPQGAAAGPVFPFPSETPAQTDSSKSRKWWQTIFCHETKEEREAKKTLKNIKRLLRTSDQGMDDTKTSPT